MIAVVDITGNNLTSLGNALNLLECDYEFTRQAECIKKASHVILPGVGSAGKAMKALREYQLIELVQSLTQPVLGICLGMQLLLEYSEEEDTSCLGLIPGSVEKIQCRPNYPVPHMGWSRLQWSKPNALLNQLSPNDYVYFVHSYALKKSPYAVATCVYSEEITAIVQKGRVCGMQFHPEKSDAVGMQLLKNFISLEALC